MREALELLEFETSDLRCVVSYTAFSSNVTTLVVKLSEYERVFYVYCTAQVLIKYDLTTPSCRKVFYKGHSRLSMNKLGEGHRWSFKWLLKFTKMSVPASIASLLKQMGFSLNVNNTLNKHSHILHESEQQTSCRFCTNIKTSERCNKSSLLSEQKD